MPIYFYFHFLFNWMAGLKLSSIFAVEYSFEHLNEYSSTGTHLNRKFCKKYVYVMIISLGCVYVFYVCVFLCITVFIPCTIVIV